MDWKGMLDAVSVPRHLSPDLGKREGGTDRLLAMFAVSPAIMLVAIPSMCPGIPFSAGIYPEIRLGMAPSDFCPTVSARLTLDYGILALGAVVALAGSRFLRARGRVYRRHSIGGILLVAVAISALAGQNTLAGVRGFTKEFEARVEELMAIRKVAEGEGAKATVSRIDDRMLVLFGGEAKSPAP